MWRRRRNEKDFLVDVGSDDCEITPELTNFEDTSDKEKPQNRYLGSRREAQTFFVNF